MDEKNTDNQFQEKMIMNLDKFSTATLTVSTSRNSQQIVRLWGPHLSEESGKERVRNFSTKGKKKQKEKDKTKH